MKRNFRLAGAIILAAVLAGCAAGTDPTAPSAVIDNSPPQAPTGLYQTTNASSVRVLEWTANSESDLAGYQVYQYSPDPTRDNAYVLVGTVAAGTTEWTLPVSGATETTWMQLRAVDTSGNRSAPSASVQVTLLPSGGGSDVPVGDVEPKLP